MTDDHRNDATVAGTALGPDRGEVLWQPGPEAWETALGRFARRHGFDDYASLQAWSVADLDGFWRAVTDELGVRWHARPSEVLAERAMPGARWFPGGTLNYAEQALAAATERPGDVAVIARSQTRGPSELTWAELSEQVARAAGRPAASRRGPRRPGRRLRPEHPRDPGRCPSPPPPWAPSGRRCAPEFGIRAVVDRFAQIEPSVLLAVDGYRYGEQGHRPPRRGGGDHARRCPASATWCACATSAPAPTTGPICWPGRDPGPPTFEAGALRPPAVGAVQLGHHRAAQGHRPRPRRHHRRAPQVPHPPPGPAPRRPLRLVHAPPAG